jgi:hypothetical protein
MASGVAERKARLLAPEDAAARRNELWPQRGLLYFRIALPRAAEARRRVGGPFGGLEAAGAWRGLSDYRQK